MQRVFGVCSCKLYELSDSDLVGHELSSTLQAVGLSAYGICYTSRDVIHLIPVQQDVVSSNGGDVLIFASGVIICWGLSDVVIKHIQACLGKFSVGVFDTLEFEELAWEYGDRAALEEETIVLDVNRKEDCKLTVSYAMAHALKLAVFESLIDATISETHYLAEELAQDGEISASRKLVSRTIGSLFLKKSEINLQSDILDTPDFIWDRDALEHLYDSVYSYLDVSGRMAILNKRLDMISELLYILSDDLKHKHASALETIIIILIMSEVALTIIFRNIF